jgi:hypothetical protein
MTNAAPAAVPGKTLGIVALVLAFLSSPIGLILGLVAKSQSKKAGASNGPATAAIVLGLIGTIILAIIIGVSVAGAGALLSQCAELGAGVHDVNGVTVTCG